MRPSGNLKGIQFDHKREKGIFLRHLTIIKVCRYIQNKVKKNVRVIAGLVGCIGSGFGGDENIVSQHSRSGNSLPLTQQKY